MLHNERHEAGYNTREQSAIRAMLSLSSKVLVDMLEGTLSFMAVFVFEQAADSRSFACCSDSNGISDGYFAFRVHGSHFTDWVA